MKMGLREDSTNYKLKEEFLKFCEMESSINRHHEGYLICDKCGGYYKLKKGESTEDFLDTCQCGGKLGFHENINPEEDGSCGESKKNLPLDVATAVILTLFGLAFQVVNFVLGLFKLKLTGTMVITSFLLVIILFLCLTLGTRLLLGFLGWSLPSSISKPKKVYLVCLGCRGYYELQPSESPDDFLDTCNCGGKLVSSSSPSLKEPKKLHPLLIPPLICILSLFVFWLIFKFNVNMNFSGYMYYINFLIVVLSQVLGVVIFRVLSVILDPLGIELNSITNEG
jgi:hypothetical protein